MNYYILTFITINFIMFNCNILFKLKYLIIYLINFKSIKVNKVILFDFSFENLNLSTNSYLLRIV